MTHFTYFQLEKQGNVALLWIDDPADKMNTLKAALMEELASALDQIEADRAIEAVVLASRKAHCFIAGADINMFQDYPEADEAKRRARKAHDLLLRLSRLRVPTVAALRGVALGGGLEVAMACNYRISASDNKTFFGVPEVKLGLLPGLGGTQRLPALIGLQASLDMLLTGKNLYPSKAYKLGLVDALHHGEGLIAAAVQFAREKLVKPGRRPRKRKLAEAALESALLNGVVFNMAAKTVQRQTWGNYPAPFAILDCVRTGWRQGLEAGIAREIELFDKMVRSDESRALVNLFFGMNDSKKNPAKDKAVKVRRMAVLGAGLMGAGIAEVSVQKDIQVVLKDISLEALGRGKKAIHDSLKQKVDRRIISAFECDRQLALVQASTENAHLAGAELVIEAVFEDLGLKRRILADVEAHAPERCIFATNTSAIPIAKIAEGAKRPEQVVGMHYFSPVPKMPLLEIIVTPQTADWVVSTAVEVGIRQGKTVIVVGDGPGFYTTRILAPLMNEAVILLSEGADMLEVDKAMLRWGFPVGPVKLMDEVGIDVGAHVGETFAPMLAARGIVADNIVQRLYEAGYHGRKNGKGFYRYDVKKGKGKQPNTEIYGFFGGAARKSVPHGEIQERLALAMINEAAYCLQEDILRSPVDGDLGAILGLGFPPFRGGPFRYIDHVGADQLVSRFEHWAAQKGPRFKPAQILLDHRGRKFHSS